MQYEILSHTSKTQLENVVRNYLNNGWSLQGGVATAVNNSNDVVFHQAMIKS